MAHFAVLCPDDVGHVLPVGGVGGELIRRGHAATLVGHARTRLLAKQLGLSLHELPSDVVQHQSSPVLWTLFNWAGRGARIALRDHLLWQADVTLQLVPEVLRELRVDGVLVDEQYAAGGSVAEHLGLPFVTVCSALPWNDDPSVPPPFAHWRHSNGRLARARNRMAYAGWRWYIRPVLARINRFRRIWGLSSVRHIDATYSPLAQISQMCAAVDFPRRRTAPVFHYVGPLTARRAEHDGAFPWKALDGRPVIFASLGTCEDALNAPILRRVLAACAGLNAQLVLSLGKWEGNRKDTRVQELGEIPGNAIIVDFAPQLALLDQAALMITHAGQNSAMECLSRGVPMVAVPRGADQPGIAARIEHAGAGLRVFLHGSTAEHWRQTIERVLTGDSYRRRARELQQAIAAAGGLRRAADIAEQALIERRPVLRPECPNAEGGPPNPRNPS